MKFNVLQVLFFIVMLTACANAQSKEKTGELDYRSDFRGNHRLIKGEGKFIIGNFQLEYHPSPKDAYDGDSGVDFYIRIKNEELLKNGAVYSFPHKDFDLYVASWASPGGYDVYTHEKLKGEFEIVEYKKYEYLILNLNLQYQVQEEKWLPIVRKIKLQKSGETIRTDLKEEDLDWLGWHSDSPVRFENFKVSALEGVWEGCDAHMLTGGKVLEKVLCRKPYYFEVKDNQFRNSKNKELQNLQLTNNSFSQKSDQIYINYVSQNKIILTHVNKWFKLQITYQKLQTKP